jgi:hypothetical protein
MSWRRLLLWSWLIAGAALLAHGGLTGGGLAGFVLWQEIRFAGAIEPVVTHIGLAVPLFAVPAFLLMPPRRGEAPDTSSGGWARWALSGCLAGVFAMAAALAAVQAAGIPAAAAPVVRVPAEQPAPPGAFRTRVAVTGRLLPQFAVDYSEVSTGRYAPTKTSVHSIMPMVGADWADGRPVHYMTDTLGATSLPGLPAGLGRAPTGTRSGVLLPGGVPGYLRTALASRGVVLADDAVLHTPDLAGAREGWWGFAAAAAALALASLAIGPLLLR